MDSLIFFGEKLKALDENGKIGGYAIRHTDALHKDLAGEYFTKSTYLGRHEGNGMDVLFHHRQPIPVPARASAATAKKFAEFSKRDFKAPTTTKRDELGLWVETVLDLADEFEKAVFGMVKAGKLGWSSATASHTAEKKSDGEITRWPIIEISLTPTPCEPLNRALTIKSIESVKFIALLDEEGDGDPVDPAPALFPNKPGALAAKLSQLIDDLVDDKFRDRKAVIAQMAREAGIDIADVEDILANKQRPTDARLKAFSRTLNVSFDALKAFQARDHAQTIKGMFEEALAEQTPSRWELEAIYCRIVKRLANAYAASKLAGVEFDLEAKMQEATNEYTSLLQSHALAQIYSWIEDGGEDDFWLKSIIDVKEAVKALTSCDLETHLELAESTGLGLNRRFQTQYEARQSESVSGIHDGQKAGRVLSAKNRDRLTRWVKLLLRAASDGQSLLDASQPVGNEAKRRALTTKFLMRKNAHRLSIGA